MKRRLITSGEFAHLAVTTKRTLHYYDKIGILSPFYIDDHGYRYYQECQILDFQIILLLQMLKFPLFEIKKFLSRNKTLVDLFDKKKSSIREEITYLTYALKNLERYFANMKENQTLVKPQIKVTKSLKIYYIEKVGSYASIGSYCDELLSMFQKRPKKVVTLAIFDEEDYRPKKSKLRIGAIYQKGMVVKREFREGVKEFIIPSCKVLTYMHNGSGSTISLFWQEVYKYMRLKKLRRNVKIPEYEIYWKVSDRPYEQYFEIFVPIL